VDWILWDSYASNSSDFSAMASRFYNVLLAKNDTAHDYDSKAWGLGEWGAKDAASQATAYALYDNAKAVLDANSLPRLKAYVIWDSNAKGSEIRTSYDKNGTFDQTEQNHYNGFAQDPHFTDASYTTSATPTPPGSSSSSAGSTSGSNKQTTGLGGQQAASSSPTTTDSAAAPVATVSSSGKLVFTPKADGGPVTISVDGKVLPAGTTTVDTTKLTNGVHTVSFTQDGKTTTQKITVKNPFVTALKNEVEAHPAAYTAGSSGSLVLLALLLFVGRKFIRKAIDRFRMRKYIKFQSGPMIHGS
jgi:hypothetical protein